jgi:tetratricopeptide (TPR) repeat protein
MSRLFSLSNLINRLLGFAGWAADSAQIPCEAPRQPVAHGLLESVALGVPPRLDSQLALAALEAELRRFGPARRTFEAVLRADPGCGRAWFGLGLIELAHRRILPAKRHFELAAKHRPDHVGTWQMQGWIHIILGDAAAAGRAFERAQALDGRCGETHGGLAAVAAMQGRQAQACEEIKHALRLQPKSMPTQYAHLVFLQRQGRYEEASTALEVLLASRMWPAEQRFRDLIAAQRQQLCDRYRDDRPAVQAAQQRIPADRRLATAAPIPTPTG